MNDIYCTYFDHNYLSRAVVTINTLRQFDATPIYVLALSDLCAEIMQALDLPSVNIIPLATLEQAYPELSAIKPTRKMIEYYFTLTPFLPHYLFAQTTADRISYIDGDLYFFASPKHVLDSLADASVAITPHRFSYPYRNHIVYGRFNVAWITFRRCEEGLACLEAYRADCLAWCYDRLEDGRFGDQKYLDAWPGRYPALKVIDHKGFNLAIWNIQNYIMRMTNGVFTVDNDPLIFYHCSSTSLNEDGSVTVPMPTHQSRSMKMLIEHVINPYIELLQSQRRELHARFPVLFGNETAIRYPQQKTDA
jgi:hypothetical protein